MLLWVLTALGAFSLFALLVRALASIAVIVQPVLRHRRTDDAGARPGVTVLVPLCGQQADDPALEMCLDTLLALAYERLEILLCVADAADPALAPVRERLRAHPELDARVLVGNDTGGPNPKINNLGKGYREARYELLLFADQNLLWAPDWVDRVVRALRGNVGLVSAAVIGVRPANFGGALECSFLNGYAAPFMLLADVVHRGFAQGVTMLVRKSDIESAGGLEVLHAHAGDDNAASFVMRMLGRSVIMVDEAAPQAIGSRSLRDVVQRHRRWAFIRRCSFPLGFHLELFTSAPVPGLLASGALALWTGFSPFLAFVLYVSAWVLLDTTASLIRGWPTHLLASLVREALLPVIWWQARRTRAVDWHGTPVRISRPQALRRRAPQPENGPSVKPAPSKRVGSSRPARNSNSLRR